MLNHVHILLRDEEENLSSFIKNLAGKYAVFFNKKYGRVGNLFQGRFQSEAVEDNTYLLTLLRYIHQNPIKAAVVRGLSAYRWSSFGEYTDRAMIIDKNFIMEMFGNDIEQFAGFHNDTISRITSRADLANNRLSDERIIAALKEKFKIHAATASALPREKALELVKIFSAQGASQRQLGRIFGLPKTTIQRWTR
jgi:hypothetical protein